MTKEAHNGEGERISGWRVSAWGIALLLLVLPLVAMQFTDEVTWTGSDFVFAGCLIGGVGAVLELAVRTTPNRAYRAGVATALLSTFLLIWLNAAVGIIGSTDNPLNLLYGLVLVIALAGSMGTGFKARGMARAMIAAAVAQVLVGAVAVTTGGSEPPGALGLLVLNGFFAALFAAAAKLFAIAARSTPVAAGKV